jgi:hypothetical protein
MKRRDFLVRAGLAGAMLPVARRLTAAPCPPPQVSVQGGTSATTTCGQGAGSSYSTNFPNTENPISEGGQWLNGAANGLDWQNVRTTTGLAFGSGTNSGYNDNVAQLTNHSIPANQQVQVTIHRASGYTPPSSHEVSLYVRMAIAAHNIRGYEILVPFGGNGGQIVRWNGALGDFTPLSVSGSGFSTVADGDIVIAKIVGSTITAYHNGVAALSATDGTWSSGNPGMGFFIRPGTGANPSSWCISSWAASAAS